MGVSVPKKEDLEKSIEMDDEQIQALSDRIDQETRREIEERRHSMGTPA